MFGLVQRYRRGWAIGDLVAGITLWAVLVPQALSYASLAGAPAVVGLYTALGGMALYMLFGTSRELNVGPEATVAIVAGTSVAPLAGDDTGRYLALVAALAIMTGVVSIVGGLLRLGWLVVFLSRPILIGYILGSAGIIASSQVESFLGIDPDNEGWITALDETHGWTLTVGVLTVVVIIGLRRLGPRVPAYIVAMVVATVAVAAGDLGGEGVAVVGHIPEGLPRLGLPNIGLGDLPSLIGPAAAIALLMYADSMLTEQSLAKANDYSVDANQEFFALGAANIGSGLVGGFPVNGSQSRSVINASAGARSQGSNLVAGALIALTLVLLTPLFEDLPRAALAGVVLVAAVSLVDIPALRRIWVLDRHDFWLALITAALVVWVDVLAGVLVAVVLSLLDAALKPYRPQMSVLARAPGTERFRNVDALRAAEPVPGLILFRIDAPLYFANARSFADRVVELVEQADPPAEEVLVSAEAITTIDSTAHEILHDLIDDLHERNVRFSLARTKPQVARMLERSGLEEKVDAFYLEVDAGVTAFGHRREPDVT